MIQPSLWTAAAAGAFSALALPLLRQWMGADAGLSLPFGMALLLVVALPAHAFVVGLRPAQAQPQPGRQADMALLKRIGAWLAAAALVTAVRLLAA